MRKFLFIFLLLIAASTAVIAQSDAVTLYRQPTMNRTDIVFVYAGDLWKVPRAGGSAIRLTSNVGTETSPIYSPDGNWIAFTGEYDGNVDVYVMAAEGGEPRRITYHPAPTRRSAGRLTVRGSSFYRRAVWACRYRKCTRCLSRAKACRPSCRFRWPADRRLSRPTGQRSRTCRSRPLSCNGKSIAADERQRSGSGT